MLRVCVCGGGGGGGGWWRGRRGGRGGWKKGEGDKKVIHLFQTV